MMAFQVPGALAIGFCETPCILFLKFSFPQTILGGSLFQTDSLTPAHPQADRPELRCLEANENEESRQGRAHHERGDRSCKGLTLSKESRRETDEAGRLEGR